VTVRPVIKDPENIKRDRKKKQQEEKREMDISVETSYKRKKSNHPRPWSDPEKACAFHGVCSGRKKNGSHP